MCVHVWVPLWSRACPYVALYGPHVSTHGVCISTSPLNPNVCVLYMYVCVCAFSNSINYGLLLAPVILSLPCHLKADVGVGWGRAGGVCWVGSDAARSALSRQHVPLYSQWGLAVCRATCFGNSSSTDGLQQREICCLPPCHCKHAHSHQVDTVWFYSL